MLYIGSNNGLYSYNGFLFNKIPFEQTLSNTFSNIYEDCFGTIWGINFSNEAFFLNQNILRKLVLSENINSDDKILYQLLVNECDVWLCFKTKILCVDAATKKVKQVYPKNKNTGDFISMSWFNQSLYIFSNDSIIWQIKDKQLQKVSKINLRDVRFVDAGSNLIVFAKGTNKYFYTIDKENNISTHLFSNNLKNQYLLHADKVDGDILYCTNKGIFKNTDSENGWLMKYRVSDIEKDFQGNYWISTLDNGIFQLSKNKKIRLNTFTDNTLSSINTYNNQLIIGSIIGKIYITDTLGNIIKTADFNQSNEIQFIHVSNSNNTIYTSYGKLDLNTLEKTFITFGRDACDIENNHILGTSGYVHTFILKNKNASNTKLFNKFKSTYIESINERDAVLLREFKSKTVAFEPKNKIKYVGYFDDLYAYDSLFNITVIRLNNSEKIICNDLAVYNNKLYAASQNNGIVIINKTTPELVIKNVGEGNLNIKKIHVSDNILYVLTYEGVYSISINDDKTYAITKIIENNGNINDFVILNNSLYLCGSEGLLKTSINNKNNLDYPKLIVESINNKVFYDSINIFPYKNRDIKIDFNITDFSLSDLKVYANLVSETDTFQSNVDLRQRSIRYNALNSGNYFFWLSTQNAAGNITLSDKVFIQIQKPYWQTWWFILLMLLSGSVILFLFIQIIIHRIKLQQGIQQKLINSQLASLRAQMNPHFIYNILNSIQGLIYSGNKKDAGSVLTKFSDLMRNALTVTDSQFVLLKDEINTLRVYLELESYRFEENDFNFSIQNHLHDESGMYKIPAFLIQPHVENAIKHGLLHKKGKKILSIEISLHNNKNIKVEITDNGIGREASAELNKRKTGKPVSFATNAINERIFLINKQYKMNISLETEDLMIQGIPAGTKITLIIPIKYE